MQAIKRAIKYITRTWENETEQPPGAIRRIPPFALEVFTYLVYFIVLVAIIKAVVSIIR